MDELSQKCTHNDNRFEPRIVIIFLLVEFHKAIEQHSEYINEEKKKR